MIVDWTERGSFSSGRDPLGFQAASVRLYTSLIPGLTNVTNRLRYYSYYCWVLWQFEQLCHTSREERWAEFIRRAEYLLALACQIGDPGNAAGMAGSDKASQEAGVPGRMVYDLVALTERPGTNGQYLKARYGNFGQFYAASMAEMGMIANLSGPVYGVTESVGRRLAEAVENKNAAACAKATEAIISGTVSREDCVAISDALHPASLAPASEEAALLRTFLEGSREDDPTGPPRRISLGNVLTVLEWGGGRPDLRAELYRQAWRSNAEDGDVNLDGWRAYFINEFCHIALEVWLNAVVGVTEARTAPSVSDAASFVAEVAVGDTESTIESLAEDVSLPDLAGEYALTSVLRDAASSGTMPNAVAIKGAATIILSLWRRWGAKDRVRHILSEATVEGRSAEGLFHFLDALVDERAGKVITTMVRKFVIANHLVIAAHKLASGGRMTHRFTLEDGLIVDGQYGKYTFTTPRIYNLLTFARDASLVDRETDKLTAEGEAFLNAV